ncbi:MAG: NAD+ synthase [Deltaproteobacteria bacterium]|nr:NAD+ synthase [Deltaproteobacteria bacterium]MBT4526582.1 NAD+ synthase [Deltaproteobacteria bacterium]
MIPKVKIAILQLNFHICDIEGNCEKIIKSIEQNQNQSVDLFITSELSIMGYPPKDYLLNKSFVKKTIHLVKTMAVRLKDQPPVIIGAPEINNSGLGKPLFNSVYLLNQGEIKSTVKKKLLPNYGVFDEVRYFESSDNLQIIEVNNHKIGMTICEDIWNDTPPHQPLYCINPLDELREQNVDLILNVSASPFTFEKQKQREQLLSKAARNSNKTVVSINQVGGADDLIFDGQSCAFNQNGKLITRAKAFEEDIIIFDTESKTPQRIETRLCDEAIIFKALVLGTKDYLNKNGFKKAVLGLSGGIDSALTAVIAERAIGKQNVTGVLMPSKYSSKGSVDDALALAENLGIETYTIPIEDIKQSFLNALELPFKGYEEDTTEENLQARIRGNILMSLSNKHHSILLTTGNKSELAVGYCTIYGDMSGGLAVISDLPKMLVYKIANWINQQEHLPAIPENIITKAPSAELRPDQTDQDSLPPYQELDQILYHHIENHLSLEEIVEKGFDSEIVKQIITLVKNSEFKRQQAAPGLKVTDQAFGSGWRIPISSKIFY